MNNVHKYGWTSKAPQSSNYINNSILDILALHQVNTDNKIIDIGCGNGVHCNDLFKNGYVIAGTDHDREAIDIASSHYSNLNFYRIGFHEKPDEIIMKEGRFDVVISTEVIEHLYALHELPISASKLLKKKGLLIISTPYHGYLKNLAISLLDGWDKHHTALWHGGHLKFWSKNTLSKLLRDNGFNVIDFHGAGRCCYLWKSMIIVAIKNWD